MKRFLLLTFAIVVFVFSASAQRYSTHSLSLSTVYGIKYGYEYKWNSGMALIGRVGAGSEIYGYKASQAYRYEMTNGFNITIEPRYYLNEQDFFSIKTNGALLIPNTPFKASLVPVYGIKRDFSKHWFCEFTVGGGVGYYSGNYGSLYFEPHLQFRIGFKI